MNDQHRHTRNISLLEPDEELDNVSKAYKIVGYSRQQFYEIRRNFQTYGAQRLLDRLPSPKNPHPNRAVIDITGENVPRIVGAVCR